MESPDLVDIPAKTYLHLTLIQLNIEIEEAQVIYKIIKIFEYNICYREIWCMPNKFSFELIHIGCFYFRVSSSMRYYMLLGFGMNNRDQIVMNLSKFSGKIFCQVCRMLSC